MPGSTVQEILNPNFVATMTNVSSRPLPASRRAVGARQVQRLEVTKPTPGQLVTEAVRLDPGRAPGEPPAGPAVPQPAGALRAQFRRRDGAAVIKRKVPAHDASAVDGGDYATVAEGRQSLNYGEWHRIETSAVNLSDGVKLRLTPDGAQVLHAPDRTPGSLAAPGGVGLGGDNTELWFRDF